jgi:hypothetical protein
LRANWEIGPLGGDGTYGRSLNDRLGGSVGYKNACQYLCGVDGERILQGRNCESCDVKMCSRIRKKKWKCRDGANFVYIADIRQERVGCYYAVVVVALIILCVSVFKVWNFEIQQFQIRFPPFHPEHIFAQFAIGKEQCIEYSIASQTYLSCW